MDSIIGKFFDLCVNEEGESLFLPKKENLDREWELFHLFAETLPFEKKELFLEYAQLRTEKETSSQQTAYKLGFKTAIRLLTETLKED